MQESGEEIFLRLQRRDDQAREAREAVLAEAWRQWRESVGPLVPRYRAAATELLEHCQSSLTRIRVSHSHRKKGLFTGRRCTQSVEKLVGWHIAERKAWVGPGGFGGREAAFDLYLLDDGRFLEHEDSGWGLGEALQCELQASDVCYPDDEDIVSKYLIRADEILFEVRLERLFNRAGLDFPKMLSKAPFQPHWSHRWPR